MDGYGSSVEPCVPIPFSAVKDPGFMFCCIRFSFFTDKQGIRRQQLRPLCRHVANSTMDNVIFDFGLLALLYKNMMSPETVSK